MKASSAKRRVSPYAQVSPPPFSAPRSRATPNRTLVVASERAGTSSSSAAPPHSSGGIQTGCSCPACTKRRHMLWQPPSPYLEDLTKSLVVSQPARRKLQLVPPRRYPTAVSPYETLREASRVGRAQLRARLQAEMAERQLQRLWDLEAAAAAERCGVDMMTYTTLLELQHRDITPEDYDVLQALDTTTKRQTLSQHDLDARFPAWRVGEGDREGEEEDAAEEAAAGGAAAVSRRDLRDAFDDEAAFEHGAPSPSTTLEEEEAAEAEAAAEAAMWRARAAVPGAPADGFDDEPTPSAGVTAQPGVVEDEGARCSICLEPFAIGQWARSLPCKHTFHAECIDAWLTGSSRRCPEDGLPVLPDEDDEDGEVDEGEEDYELDERGRLAAAADAAAEGEW